MVAVDCTKEIKNELYILVRILFINLTIHNLSSTAYYLRHHVVDPGVVGRHACVNRRSVDGAARAESPGGDSDQLVLSLSVLLDQWATRVTSAETDSTLDHGSSADVGVSQGSAALADVLVAIREGDDWGDSGVQDVGEVGLA